MTVSGDIALFKLNGSVSPDLEPIMPCYALVVEERSNHTLRKCFLFLSRKFRTELFSNLLPSFMHIIDHKDLVFSHAKTQTKIVGPPHKSSWPSELRNLKVIKCQINAILSPLRTWFHLLFRLLETLD